MGKIVMCPKCGKLVIGDLGNLQEHDCKFKKESS